MTQITLTSRTNARMEPLQLELDLTMDNGEPAIGEPSFSGLTITDEEANDAESSLVVALVVEVEEPLILDNYDYASAVFSALKRSDLPPGLKEVLVDLGGYLYRTAWYAEECGASTLIFKGADEIVQPVRPQREATDAAWEHLYATLEHYGVRLRWVNLSDNF